ncbi:flagellar basal body rod protein FlgB [Desulfocurvus sp.]|jgi:flagellar basal-body rod protein FlgB|uniref:flagellar basal body rod protein FlgB n=1 Tax=Desulfocurvus sp. TaxID=2871698 RepID=UPI0025BF49CB|nr:flagellar basal body rod protein FlgB [Desulfocurvus sp.]MCK9240721.1 flagellar basal body rod protein FlgB [Desulfocurvus sp.]
MKSLFDSNVHLTGKVLDLRLQRQNVVMSNLANITTPNYKARRLEFEADLQAALNRDARGKITRTDEKHMPTVFAADGFRGDLVKGFKHRIIHGEDNVDLDKEMSVMAKNTLMYNALGTVLQKQFDGLATVITEGAK